MWSLDANFNAIFRALTGLSLALVMLTPVARAEIISPRASIAGQQYATEEAPTSRVSLDGEMSSESTLYGRAIPVRDLHLYSFFETGQLGDMSFDLDTMVLRARVNHYGHLWIGRNHPLQEGFEFGDANLVSHTSAIGANWVQNQSNALSPRVSGWLGGGFHYKQAYTGMFVSATFSPVFLPSFGPRLDLSEHDPASGSRFATLPPAYIDINDNGVYYPMRYRVRIDDLKAIILQPQAFVAIGQENDFHRLTLMAWSAPSPAPQVKTFGKVAPTSGNVDVLVEATPQFARENFVGSQWIARGFSWQPRFEAVFEMRSQRASFSAAANPTAWLAIGGLTTVGLPAPDPEAPVVSPNPYYKDLIWAEITPLMGASRFQPALRLEQHLSIGTTGRWLYPTLAYRMSRHTSFFASASILTGTDNSYFGNWRSLDSIAAGARFVW